MDVSLSGRRFLFSFFLLLSFAACGNRFDLAKEHGRQARIDEANAFLSQGNCSAALEAINPLYASQYVDAEVRIITSSAYACMGGFKMLTLLSSIAGASNYFTGIVKSQLTSNAQNSYYAATDVITQGGHALQASQRSQKENDYMVFLQMGVIGSILRAYGAPDSNGNQTAGLVYTTGGNPAGEMSDTDACALTAALGMLSDSFNGSSLSDGDSTSVKNAFNSICTAAGLSSCADLNKDRSLCDGTNANSVTAAAVVSGVDGAW